jgi:hypothetical protein
MRFFPALRIGVLITGTCACLQGQSTQSNDPQVEARGLPPRATPADYQAQAQAGPVTIAAEFKGHFITTLQGTLTTEDYVVIETGFFGSPGARLMLAADDFSVRINGRKAALPAQHFGLVIGSVKDPEWEPPGGSAKSKSKGGVSTGGQGQGDPPPAPPKMPLPLQRAMAQRVQKAAFPEGDRALPQAGLIFFEYRGKT